MSEQTTPVEPVKATVKQVKEFFSGDGQPVLTNTEILEFKKQDQKGYDAVAFGIGDGSFTY